MTAQVPPLGPDPELVLPEYAERRLPNGLTVVAVRAPGIPLVELRLRIPFGTVPRAAAALLTNTLIGGTADTPRPGITGRIQAIGGQLGATLDADRLLVSGGCLAGGLTELLALLAELLCRPGYPADEVAVERARLAEYLSILKAQPDTVVFEALSRRVHGDHPYAIPSPEGSSVLAVEPAELHAWHGRRIGPAGAWLAVVGDLDPARALDQVAAALGDWRAGEPPAPVPPVPPLDPGPVELVHRSDPVQACIRLAVRTVARTHPDHAALCLANLVLGGFFSSRLVANLRERYGYAYTAGSTMIHAEAGSAIMISADVAPPRTAAAWWETHAEIGRLVCGPVTEPELAQARRYAIGTVQLSLASRRRVADLVTELASSGLRLDWLRAHVAGLRAVNAEQVTAAARRYLAPGRPVGVILCDAATVRPELELLTPVAV